MNHKTVLVTGVNGFVGHHLAKDLHARGVSVGGIGREAEPSPAISSLLKFWRECDLVDKKQVDAIDFSQYDAVISLAGLANMKLSFSEPELYQKINVDVLKNVCQRIVDQKLSTRVIAVSSGAVYDSTQSLPLTELSKINPSGSPYSKSKLAMEQEALNFRKNFSLDCVIVRPFNHSGPGQQRGFLIPDLCYKILEAKKSNGVVKVGDLSTKRDYTDVRDVARAYADLALIQKPLAHTVYNVCSGKSLEGSKILEMLLKATKTSGKIKIEQDPSLLRPTDAVDLYGSNERLNQETNWRPSIPLEQTIHDFVADI